MAGVALVLGARAVARHGRGKAATKGLDRARARTRAHTRFAHAGAATRRDAGVVRVRGEVQGMAFRPRHQAAPSRARDSGDPGPRRRACSGDAELGWTRPRRGEVRNMANGSRTERGTGRLGYYGGSSVARATGQQGQVDERLWQRAPQTGLGMWCSVPWRGDAGSPLS